MAKKKVKTMQEVFKENRDKEYARQQALKVKNEEQLKEQKRDNILRILLGAAACFIILGIIQVSENNKEAYTKCIQNGGSQSYCEVHFQW